MHSCPVGFFSCVFSDFEKRQAPWFASTFCERRLGFLQQTRLLLRSKTFWFLHVAYLSYQCCIFQPVDFHVPSLHGFSISHLIAVFSGIKSYGSNLQSVPLFEVKINQANQCSSNTQLQLVSLTLVFIGNMFKFFGTMWLISR